MIDFHKPVLLAEVLKHLKPEKDQVIVDCTIGGAGHAVEIIEMIGKKGMLLGLDLDDEALDVAKKTLAPFSQQIKLIKANFRDLSSVLKDVGIQSVDGILFDLGVSSHQIDKAKRGFSFLKEGPLDMRMDRKQSLNAKDVVNTYPQKELESVFKEYGEERYARRIAGKICESRKVKPIQTTKELQELINTSIPSGRRSNINPATRVFQAIRIEVNKELENLRAGLSSSIKCLSKNGRIVVISYHSLEDRTVKRFFKKHERGCVCPPDIPRCICGKKPILRIITKKAVRPGPEEIRTNPRSRSAKLRAAEKIT